MLTLLYVIWFLIPLFFFSIALWSTLESAGGKHKRENPGDFFRQGVFALVCVLISVAIDQTVLEGLVGTFSPDFIPLGVYQVLLLPFILYLAARILGPTQDIRIKKAPRSGRKN